MIQTYLRQFILLIILLALQILVLNHVHIYGYATPMICIYFILSLPLSTSRSTKLLLGFAIGLIQDIFANTPGMMAATLTLVALLQNPLLIIFGDLDYNDDRDDDMIPSIHTLGVFPFLKYIAAGIIIQNTVFYLLESFSFFSLRDIAYNIVGSTVLSFLAIWAIDSMRSAKKN